MKMLALIVLVSFLTCTSGVPRNGGVKTLSEMSGANLQCNFESENMRTPEAKFCLEYIALAEGTASSGLPSTVCRACIESCAPGIGDIGGVRECAAQCGRACGLRPVSGDMLVAGGE